jgi:hypothetical protein
MRFGTYNLEGARPGQQDALCAVIRALRVDVLAVQEVHAYSLEAAAERLVELGDRVGLTPFHVFRASDADPAHQVNRIAIGASAHDAHLGLLWDPERVRCVRDSFRSYDRDNFHHGMVVATFEVPGSDGQTHLVRHASAHLTPFGPYGARADEAVRVVSALTRPLDRPAALVGLDANTVGADRCADGSFYDPDPYAGYPWRPEFIYQCQREYDEFGRIIRWWADRTTGQALIDGGLLDARVALHNATAAVGGVPWAATTGYRSRTVGFGPRRICGIRATIDAVPALRASEIADPAYFARHNLSGIDPILASDHFAEVVEYDPAVFSAVVTG